MVYMFLAEGFEEVEAMAPLDILRRGGVEIKTVGITGEYVKGAHDITIKSDIFPDAVDMNNCEAVILPGGGLGTDNLDASDFVKNCVKIASQKGLLICAICAAPSVLGKMGLLAGKKATCYPGFEEFLDGAEYTAASVEKSGNYITSNGMGSAYKFGFEILSYLKDSQTAEKIREQIQH